MAGVLLVELGAISLVAAGASIPTLGDVALGAFLTLLSAVHTELATGIERIRRRAAETSYFDLSSVWTFTAALLLPPVLAAAVIAAVYVHLWHRVWRPAKVPLYRHVYTTATVVLAAGAAHSAIQLAGGLPSAPDDIAGVAGIGLAVLFYIVVNTLLVAVAIALTSERMSVRDLVGRWDDNALEVATICLGVLAAVTLGSTPGLVALVLPPILVLHRAVLVRQLEEVASTDGKTGLLNAGAWQSKAARSVRRVHRSGGMAAVLILDLDHFKSVNDAHGHLAGDEVLRRLAAACMAQVRDGDTFARFGGEEFAVLLPQTGIEQAMQWLERLRQQVSELRVELPEVQIGVTVSIGVASPTVAASPAGMQLNAALRLADEALYRAKRDGKNRVAPTAVAAA